MGILLDKVKIWGTFRFQTTCIFVSNKYTVFTISDTVSQIIMTGEIQVCGYAWHCHLLYSKLSSNVGMQGMWACSFFLSFQTLNSYDVNHSEICDQSDRWWWDHHCYDTILSDTLTLVAYVRRSEITKFEAEWKCPG